MLRHEVAVCNPGITFCACDRAYYVKNAFFYYSKINFCSLPFQVVYIYAVITSYIALQYEYLTICLALVGIKIWLLCFE